MANRNEAAEVFRTPFEIVGEGVEIAEAFYAERDEIIDEHFAVADKYGAKGYRPGHDGGIRSLLFDGDLPEGFRKVGSVGDEIEAVPRKTSKAGKEAARLIGEVRRAPPEGDLAKRFGWNIGRVLSTNEKRGAVLYHATATRLTLPDVRYLITIPRHDADEWAPPSTLRELTQTEYRHAFAAHNAEVKEKQAAA